MVRAGWRRALRESFWVGFIRLGQIIWRSCCLHGILHGAAVVANTLAIAIAAAEFFIIAAHLNPSPSNSLAGVLRIRRPWSPRPGSLPVQSQPYAIPASALPRFLPLTFFNLAFSELGFTMVHRFTVAAMTVEYCIHYNSY